MNVNKNTVYYVNLGVFVLLAVYSLLFSINAFNFENIDMNAGLCAVVVIMVVALLMYVVQATRLASVLYSMPLAKITLEIVSTLFLLTAACVIKVYFLEQLEIYIVREGIVLVCIFMAYLVARMLNQFGFITLLVLAPWPLLLSTYNLEMSQLIVMVEIMAVLLVVTFILYMVRHQKKFKNMMMGVFCVAVVGLLVYVMHSQGNQIVQVANPMQYISMYESLFKFAELERFYYIGVITAAILGAIRMWFGKGSGNSLVAFAASAAFVTMVLFGIGGQYMYLMYPVLAIVASGACGTRPAYMDEEVQLNDNMEGVSANYNKKPSVETSYVDESELDKMLDELENNKPYSKAGSPFNPVKFAAESSEEEEMPIELQMYDFGSDAPASQPVTPVAEEKKVEQETVEEKKAESSPETVSEVVEEVAETVEETVSETAKQVAEQVACEVSEVVEESVAIEEIIEVVDEVAMEPEVVKEAIEDVVEEPVVEESVVEELVAEIPVMEETVKEETIIEEPQIEETGSLTSAAEFEMPVFAMDTVAFANEDVASEEPVEFVVEDLTEAVEEVSVDDSAKLVVTDESAESISSAEEFSMPTFEMDTVSMDNVSEIFEEEKTEEIVEEVIENVEVQAEEVKDDLIIAAEDSGSVAMSEEFSMPTFEMSSFDETVDVIEEITSEPVMESVEEAAETMEEVVEEEPVVLVENPIFIKNPINFNRTRNYESQSEEHKNYGFEFSAPTFETMGSFLEDNKENAFPQFETTQGAIDEFVSSFVTDEDEKAEEKETEESVEEVVVEEFSAIESISVDSSDEEDDSIELNTDSDVTGGIFEYSTEETGRIDDIEMPGFMASDFDSTDLFGTFNPDSVDEEDDYDDSTTQKVVVEPETVELGLDLDEDFSFGQAQSLTDWYDYDSAAPSFIVDEPEVEFAEVEEIAEEFAEAEETVEKTVEEVAEEVIEEFTETIIEDAAVADDVESVTEVAVPGKDDDVYDWDAADAKFAYEDETEIVAENVVNEVKATDSDYFDWSAYDAYDFDEEEKQEADVVAETVNTSSAVSENSFEEFVWTDEMINAMETEEKVEEKFDDAVEEIEKAVDEVAVSMEYDYSSDEPDQYEVFQSTGNFVPEVEEVVEETQYEVFQSTGNFVPEVEEVVEETQYEVFQSTGNFVPEVEEVVEEIQYKTYGQEEESGDAESEKDSKANDYDSSKSKGFQIDLPDFDLDLPNF